MQPAPLDASEPGGQAAADLGADVGHRRSGEGAGLLKAEVVDLQPGDFAGQAVPASGRRREVGAAAGRGNSRRFDRAPASRRVRWGRAGPLLPPAFLALDAAGSTPALDPVFVTLNPGALPARERSPADLYAWSHR
jgi:hypothetical protein